MILRILRFAGAGLMLLVLMALGFSVSSCASNGARLSALEGTAPPAPYRIERDEYGVPTIYGETVRRPPSASPMPTRKTTSPPSSARCSRCAANSAP